ncbi:MAG: DUF3108 domain-containing protein [Burkholderiaceae bacterium]
MALGAALALALLLHALVAWWIAPLLARPADTHATLQAFKAPLLSRMIAPQTPAPVSAAPTPASARNAAAPAPAARVIESSAGAVDAVSTTATASVVASVPASVPASISAPDTQGLVESMAAASDAPGTVEAASPAAVPAPLPAPLSAALPAPLSTPPPAPGTDPHAEWPTDTRLSYRLQGFYRGPIDGDAQVTWQREGDRYQVQIAIRMALFLRVTLTSQGRIVGDQLQPAAYQEQMPNRTRSVRIEGTQVLLGNGSALPRPDGVQDTASQFVALSHRFATGRQALAEGEVVRLWMARPGGLDEWTYDVRGPVTLGTPAWGAVQAFHLVPRPIERPRGNITAQMWFAPSLQYLPARIRIALGEEAWLDLMVERIDQAAR